MELLFVFQDLATPKLMISMSITCYMFLFRSRLHQSLLEQCQIHPNSTSWYCVAETLKGCGCCQWASKISKHDLMGSNQESYSPPKKSRFRFNTISSAYMALASVVLVQCHDMYLGAICLLVPWFADPLTKQTFLEILGKTISKHFKTPENNYGLSLPAGLFTL